MKIKKIISGFMFFTLALFQGCGSSNEYITPDKIAKNQSETIIRCVKDKDIEGLKEILCERLKEKDDIDTQIQELFDFVDGDIISYDNPRGGVRGGETTPEETILKRTGGEIRNIVTDTERHYLIDFEAYVINKGNEDYIGVSSISISDEDAYDQETGYGENGFRSIGVKVPEPIRE